MGEPRGHGRPENCVACAGEGSTGIHCGRIGVLASSPGGGGCYWSAGGTGRPRGVVETLASNHTPTDTNGYGDFA